jgi:phosphatidylinositol-bisphosphatase
VGSITGNGSFLGSDELERYFPDRKMRIFIGTWNMCELKEIPSSLDEFILPETSEYVHDMYVIGTQESCPNRSVTRRFLI